MMTMWRLVFLIGALLGSASRATAQAAPSPAMAPAACAAIKGADFSRLQDAPTGIVSAAVVKYQPWRADLGVGNIDVCQVEGFVTPTIGFKLVMPVSGWNGKYIQGGCGGACGTTKLFWCDDR